MPNIDKSCTKKNKGLTLQMTEVIRSKSNDVNT